VDNGDNGDKSGKEGVKAVQWCDHVAAKGHNLWNGPPLFKIMTRGVNLFVRGGEVYIMCDTCIMNKLQVPLYRN
jgi:hypothetical protein